MLQVLISSSVRTDKGVMLQPVSWSIYIFFRESNIKFQKGKIKNNDIWNKPFCMFSSESPIQKTYLYYAVNHIRTKIVLIVFY